MESSGSQGDSKFIAYLRKVFLVLFLLTFFFSATTGQQKSTRQSSMAAFSQGDFESAYIQFSELLLQYPRDPLYKYYSGVCLVKLEKEPAKAVSLLKEAKTGSSVVKSLPSDAVFWLGRAQQLAGQYDDAIVSFNDFTSANGRQTVRDMGVPAFIQLCRDRKGALADEGLSAADEPVKMITQKNLTESPGIPENEKIGISNSQPKNLPDDLNDLIDDAFRYQSSADSLSKKADEMEKELTNLPYREKAALRASISALREDATALQKKADEIYENVRLPLETESIKSDSTSGKESVIPAIIEINPGVTEQKASIEETMNDEVQKTNEPAEQKSEPELSGNISGNNEYVPPKEVETLQKPLTKEVFSVFEVLDPGNEKIEINPSIPEGLVYRIQIAVFRNPVIPSYFKGITPVYGFKVSGTDRTAYYAGAFRKIADARKSLTIVRQKGFRDAFIASIMNGKTVSPERAALLEKEWGGRPLFVVESDYSMPADTIPPELCFRIEVMKSQKPLKDDVLEGLKKAAGLRRLETEKSTDGTTVYLIGRFITYESATSFADLLIRNGYRETKVVARLGNKEISVEKARELFEKTD